MSRANLSPAVLAPLASRFVDVERLPWEKTRYAGVETKTLLVDRKSGLLTLLMKMAPGARLPDHEHIEIEQTYVLEGSLVCGEGECKAGEFVWRPAGSLYDADGRETDFLGNDWHKVWGSALKR